MGNVYGLSHASLESLFSQFKALRVVQPPCSSHDDKQSVPVHDGFGAEPAQPNHTVADSRAAGTAERQSAHCFVEFATEEDASEAFAAIPAGTPWAAANGRTVVVKYAAIKDEEEGASVRGAGVTFRDVRCGSPGSCSRAGPPHALAPSLHAWPAVGTAWEGAGMHAPPKRACIHPSDLLKVRQWPPELSLSLRPWPLYSALTRRRW